MSSKENNNKRGRGPPPKEEQIKNKIARMEESLEDAILKGNQKIVANYHSYLDVLHQAAMGKNGASPTNQISCAKVLIDKCESILEPKKSKGGEDSDNDTPETEVPQTSSLISLTAV